MKTADTLMASWITLTHAMQTDVRFKDFFSGLTALNTKLDAAGNSTKAEDMLVIMCMISFVGCGENYTAW